jgi:hypothetical protein
MRHASDSGFAETKERLEVLHRNSLRLLAKRSNLVISRSHRSELRRSDFVVDQGSVLSREQNEAPPEVSTKASDGCDILFSVEVRQGRWSVRLRNSHIGKLNLNNHLTSHVILSSTTSCQMSHFLTPDHIPWHLRLSRIKS